MNEGTVNGEDPGMPALVSGREAIKLLLRGVVRDETDGFVEIRSMGWSGRRSRLCATGAYRSR
jgi:hypothetical protein